MDRGHEDWINHSVDHRFSIRGRGGDSLSGRLLVIKGHQHRKIPMRCRRKIDFFIKRIVTLERLSITDGC